MRIVWSRPVFLSLIFAAFGALQVYAQQNSSITPKEIVVNAFKSLGNQKSLTAETIMTSNQTSESSKIVFKFLAPDNSHFVWTYQGKVFSEIITVGQDEYSNFEGKWEIKKRGKFDDFVDNLCKLVECSMEKYMVNVGFVGKELINGSETNVYQYDYDLKARMKDFVEKMQLKSTLPERSDEMKAKIWINPEGLPVKFESVSKTEESKGKFVVLIKTTTYRFDREVKIAAPKIAAGVKE